MLPATPVNSRILRLRVLVQLVERIAIRNGFSPLLPHTEHDYAPLRHCDRIGIVKNAKVLMGP